MDRLSKSVTQFRPGALRMFARGVVACALVLGARPVSATDINAPTTWNTSSEVTDDLNIVSGGSLDVNGSLHVVGNISNNGLPAGITVGSHSLLADSDVFNGSARTFIVTGTGSSFIAGELQNFGMFSFGDGSSHWADLRVGTLDNAAGADLLFRSHAFLDVTGAITNAGDVTFELADFETISGQTLSNSGNWSINSGTYVNRGTTNNAAGGIITLSYGAFNNWNQVTNNGEIRLTSGSYNNYAATSNNGFITLTSGNFQNSAGGTLTNQGVVTVTRGKYINYGTTNNQSGGSINIASGDFENHLGGTLTNDGSLILTAGNFQNQAGSIMQGNGLTVASGSATFGSGSYLRGSPTISAAAILLQGAVVPGTTGTVGQVVLRGATNLQGTVMFDLVTPGSAGVGNDRLLIADGYSGTVSSGASFVFHLANPSRNVGDTYEIMRGAMTINARPTVTDDIPGDDRRIILLTDQDINGFSNNANVFYAIVARSGSYEQFAINNGGNGNQIALGQYLDQFLSQGNSASGATNSDLQWIRDTLDLMPSEANVVQALGQMSGEIYAPLTAVALQRQFAAYNQLATRLRKDMFSPCGFDQLAGQTDRYAALAGGYQQAENWVMRGWVTGYGFGGALAGDQDADGCSYAGGGVQATFGYQVSNEFGFGFFYDFGAFGMKNDYDDLADGNGHSFGGYAGWHRDNDYFMFLGGGGFAGYNATRNINFQSPEDIVARTAHGSPTGSLAAFYGEYGRLIRWENAQLRPYFGLLYMNVLQNAFTEYGADALNLTFDESMTNSVRTLFGSQLDLRHPNAPNAIWTFRTQWMHECINNATTGSLTGGLVGIPNGTFTLTRPNTGADWFIMGVGIRGSFLAKHLRPYADYDFIINSCQSFHAGFGGIEYVW
jgi:uncharacterized protein with beta-barrel porin domain